MLDDLEISQFTSFQQCGGIDLDLVPAELTYGVEYVGANFRRVDSVYDMEVGSWRQMLEVRSRRRASILRLQLRNGRRRASNDTFFILRG